MFNEINNFILIIADFLLGWMLYLPQDACLVLIALLTALTLTLVRVYTTDQELLGRCKRDKKQLKQLVKKAKRDGDKPALGRYRQTMGQLGLKSMLAEGKPLLASLLPICIFAIWAFTRLAYIPPQADSEIEVKMYFPASGIDSYVHIVPVDGIESQDGWIQKVEEDSVADENGSAQGFSSGVVVWTLRGEQRSDPYVLTIRYGDENITRDLALDGMHYTEPVSFYGEDPAEVIEFTAREYKLFGFVPGIEWLMLSPWMMGYLLIVLPLSFILKPVLRIH